MTEAAGGTAICVAQVCAHACARDCRKPVGCPGQPADAGRAASSIERYGFRRHDEEEDAPGHT
jgi:hypothetical protein